MGARQLTPVVLRVNDEAPVVEKTQRRLGPALGAVTSDEEHATLSRTPVRSAGGAAARVLMWGVLAFAAVAALVMLWWPLGHDQGIFALNGATVVAGGAPYRDAFETRGPLAFWTFAALRLLFGPHAWGVRVLDLAVAAATAGVLYRAVRDFGSPRAAELTVAGWVLAVVSLRHQDSAQFELWIGAGVLAAALRVCRPEGYRPRDLAVFGFVVGLATLTKQFFPVFLAVPGVIVLDRRRAADLPGTARDLGVLVAAAAAPVVAALAWFQARGLLADMWEAHTLYSLRVYSGYRGSGGAGRLRSTLDLLRGGVVPTAAAAAAAGLMALWRPRRALALGLGMALVCGLFTVEIQGRFFPYHWSILYPVLVLLAALGCVSAGRAGAGGRRLGALVAGVMLVQIALDPLNEVQRWARYVSGLRSADWYYHTFTVWITNPAEERAAAQYLRGRTRPGEAVGMWAVDAAVPFLADRPLAGRFSERRVLSLPSDDPLTQQYRVEFAADAVRWRPAYFVVNRRLDGAERPLAEAVPALAALVAAEYVRDTTFGALEVLRRRDAARGATVPPASRVGW